VRYSRYRSTHRARRIGLLAALLAVALVAGAVAARAQRPAPPADGTGEREANAALRAWLAGPLELRLGATTVTMSRETLGAGLDRRGFEVVVDEAVLGRRLEELARRHDHPARDAELRLVGAVPVVTRPRTGRKLLVGRAVAAVRAALRAGNSEVALPVRAVSPGVTDPGAIVVVRRESHTLALYQGERLVRRFEVAVGLPEYPTPLGRFEIVTKQRDPWWYPPDSDWAEGAEPVPPGPGNPLGTRWMGLSVGAVGIHGTPDAASIGYSASHGCIRMRIADAEWLFERVRIGTPVFIVRA
jgi:lipoprotein-anchoring transpeptidase ErfK/SrfK